MGLDSQRMGVSFPPELLVLVPTVPLEDDALPLEDDVLPPDDDALEVLAGGHGGAELGAPPEEDAVVPEDDVAPEGGFSSFPELLPGGLSVPPPENTRTPPLFAQ